MRPEIHLFLKYLLSTHSGSGAVLSSGGTKVNDPNCKEASGCGKADRWAGGCDAVCGSLMKVFQNATWLPRISSYSAHGVAEGFLDRELCVGSRSG